MSFKCEQWDEKSSLFVLPFGNYNLFFTDRTFFSFFRLHNYG